MREQFFRPMASCLLTAALCLSSTFATADNLPLPQGEILLTISGAVEHTNNGETTVFDIEMLQQLGAMEFTTNTIWTEGPQKFTGVPLKALVAYVDAQGATLRATAINDYAVDIPVDSLADDGPIVAYFLNDVPMSVREKGPLWVVYPYDSNDDYRNEVIYSRSVWQLDRIVIKD
ncbi:oxidoreductase [Thalassovita taeanensis]|uniref:oxidoreductase n=1 Tax=Thalassovita taeanensis TaxID=657014 RepID=UPI001FE434EC|nr:oxidoreductase [Thalassovita taeanensis]